MHPWVPLRVSFWCRGTSLARACAYVSLTTIFDEDPCLDLIPIQADRADPLFDQDADRLHLLGSLA